jgi:hypothetical protein
LYVFQDGHLAAILKMRERKKCSFQYTKLYLQHKIGDCCIMFCDGHPHGRTYKVKTIRQLSFESTDIIITHKIFEIL